MPISNLMHTSQYARPMLFAGLMPLLSPVLADTPANTLAEVVVVDTSATADYTTSTVSVGPLAARSLLDTPYSIAILPAQLLARQQVKSVREAFRYLPSVQGENIRPQSRGLQAGVVQNTRMDGMNIAATTEYPIEQFERVEVLNGLSGALYGPAYPAGTFNYILKRPTTEPLRRLSLGYASKNSLMGSVDLSGPIDDDKRINYRLNLLHEDGDGYVEHSTLQRKLVSAAFDLRLTEHTRLETNASRYHHKSFGFPGTFSLASNVIYPAAPDPKRVGYGQAFGGDDNMTHTYSARVKHSFTPTWQLDAGVLQQDSDRASTVPTHTLLNNTGTYRTTAATTTYSLDRILSNTLALNGKLTGAGLTHDIVIASNGFEWRRYTPYQTGAITLGNATLEHPVIFSAPLFPDFKHRYRSVSTRQQSLTLADTIGFNERWSLGLALSQSSIKASNFNRTGATTATYAADGISSNATLSYKPHASAQWYASYADSLQPGDFAPAGTVNAGNGLAPYRSEQWEIGYKMQWQQLQLSSALFRIERPYAWTGNDNVFRERGQQINTGLELSANGNLTRNLSLFAGLSLLDPRVFDTGASNTSDKQILGLARHVSSLLLDYRLPFAPQVAISTHLNHVARRPGNNTNSDWVAGYTTLDVGLRYTHLLLGRASTWNLTVNNLSDRRYWANISPRSQNGYSGVGNGTGTLGAPRNLRLTLQIDL